MREPFIVYALVLPLLWGCTQATQPFCSVSAVNVLSESSSRSETYREASLFATEPLARPTPIARAPLVAIIEFESTVAVTAKLQMSDGERTWEQPGPAGTRRKHRLAALGMRPGRKHSIRVQVETIDGSVTETSPAMHFATPVLPESFPPLQTIVTNPEKMEPGLTLFAVNMWLDDVSILDYGYIVALDQEGQVVWYCETEHRIADLRILRNGNLLYQHGSYRFAHEIDILGRDIRCWYASRLTKSPYPHAIAVDVDTMHHDLFELPNGNFMTIATEVRRFEKFPTSEFDPESPWEPADVVCDDVVEFVPSTGQVVERTHLTDFLDPNRFGYTSLGAFWNDKYAIHFDDPPRDWSHANAIVALPNENALLVSFRHLDCLIKLDWKTKKIRWILGNPDGWGPAWQKFLLKPAGEVQWSYHHHAPQVTPQGTILMYDNGNYRARPFDALTLAPDNASRVVEYRVDEAAMTVEQIYEFRGINEEKFYCPFYCEADWLPATGNLLVTNGGHIELEDGTPHDDAPGERQWASIFEITRNSPVEKVFEIECESPLGSHMGWSIYRAIRIPNLTTPFSIVPPAPGEHNQVFPRRRAEKLLPPPAEPAIEDKP